jgi:hypothetical protein
MKYFDWSLVCEWIVVHVDPLVDPWSAHAAGFFDAP